MSVDIKTSGQSGNAYLTPYLVYTALISQAGTDSPTIESSGSGVNTPYANSIGAIVWTRDVEGIYLGTLIGAFIDPTKVSFLHASNGNDTKGMVMYVNDNDSVAIETYSNGVLADNFLSSTTIEIRVYP